MSCAPVRPWYAFVMRGRGALSMTSSATALLLFALAAALFVEAPLCPSAALLGLPCPGCGLTRATLALLSGELDQALRLHPLVVVVVPALAVTLGMPLASGRARAAFGRDLTGRGTFASRAVAVAGMALLVLLLVVWGLRFAGWFGGPAPVETLADWWRAHVR